MIPSTHLAVHKVDDDRECMGQPTMSKENIINLNSFNQYCQVQAHSGSLSGSSSASVLNPKPKPNLKGSISVLESLTLKSYN